jgi:hypothetical protein
MEIEYVNQMEKEHSKSSSTCAYQTWGSRGIGCACEFLGNDRIIVGLSFWSRLLLHVKPYFSCEVSLLHVISSG